MTELAQLQEGNRIIAKWTAENRKRHKLSTQESLIILRVVGEEGATPTELAGFLGVSTAVVSRPLKKLVEKGFLYREFAPGGDLRQIYYQPKCRARHLVAKVQKMLQGK